MLYNILFQHTGTPIYIGTHTHDKNHFYSIKHFSMFYSRFCIYLCCDIMLPIGYPFLRNIGALAIPPKIFGIFL